MYEALDRRAAGEEGRAGPKKEKAAPTIGAAFCEINKRID
jgi:hypothetical protein